MFEYIAFLKRETTNPTKRSILTEMSADGDRRNFAQRIQLLTASYVEAIINYMFCYAALYGERANFKQALEMQVQYLSNVEKNIIKYFKKEDSKIKDRWFEYAKIDIENQLATNVGIGHSKFALTLNRFLEQKYFWLVFMVVSFEENEAVNEDFQVHISYDALFFRKLGKRNLFVPLCLPKNGKDFYEDKIKAMFVKDYFLKRTTAFANGACNDILKRMTDVEPKISVLILSNYKSFGERFPDDRQAAKWTWSYVKLGVDIFNGRDSVEIYESYPECTKRNKVNIFSCHEYVVFATRNNEVITSTVTIVTHEETIS